MVNDPNPYETTTLDDGREVNVVVEPRVNERIFAALSFMDAACLPICGLIPGGFGLMAGIACFLSGIAFGCFAGRYRWWCLLANAFVLIAELTLTSA